MNSEEFSIRDYQAGDRDGVVALWREAFAGDPPRNEPNAVFDRKEHARDGLFFVRVLANRVVGTVLAGFDGIRGWIYHLAVLPEFRRRGLADRMMDHVEAELRTRDCPKINLQVRTSNAEVAAFYERRGYAIDQVISFGKTLGGDADSSVD